MGASGAVAVTALDAAGADSAALAAFALAKGDDDDGGAAAGP